MSKAEERANERYPLMQEGDEEMLESLKYVGMECDSVYEYNSIKYSQQAYFIEGYLQAEKDLELTLEDVRKIFALFTDIFNERNRHYPINPEGFCQEVLNRFKDYKRQQANSCKI